MTKIQLFSLSLVGAIPAAFLSYLLIMYLINQPSGGSSMVMIVAIITLLCAVTVAVMPGLVMGMYYSNYDPPKAPKAVKEKAKGKDKGKAKDEEEEAAEESEAEQAEEDDVGEIEELSSSDDLVAADSSDLIETEEEES